MTSRTVAAFSASAAVVLVALVYLLPLTGGRGTPMDEGSVVAYSARMLDGAVPHRDFLTFYGPGNLWIVAGAFAVFGESVATERAVGLLYRTAVVLALFLLGARLAGIWGGVLAGIVATVLLDRELVWAYATFGALAFGLLGIALTAWALSTTRRTWQAVGFAAAGVAGGLGVLVRFDFAPAVLVGALPLLVIAPRRGRWWYAGALLGAMALYVFHLVLVGPERIARVVSDLVASGPGRTLPLARPWAYPGNLLAVSVVVLVLCLFMGALLWRRRVTALVPQLLVSVSLFGLAILPYSLSRPDAAHIRPSTLLPLSLLPALALFLIREYSDGERSQEALAAVALALTLIVVFHYGDFTPDRARKVMNVRDEYRGFVDNESIGAEEAVERLRELAKPGESLFVGPQDLRRTNYGPTYMYFLFQDLEPASYYMEMNPGTANREGSGLADDLRRADWLVLTSEWDDWNEPNDSMEFGSDEPNQVVREGFCLRFERGLYRVYERCDRTA